MKCIAHNLAFTAVILQEKVFLFYFLCLFKLQPFCTFLHLFKKSLL